MTGAGHEDAAATFEPLRPKLMRVAYRMLGSVADAENAVQEAFIRWMRAITFPAFRSAHVGYSLCRTV